MAVALVVEDGTGKANANSYATAAEGDAYHETHLYSDDWDSADNTRKAKALIWATRLIDANMDWDGYRFTDTQALGWPRSEVYRDGLLIDANTIPVDLKSATIELARLLLPENRTAERETIGITRVKAGELDIVFDKSDERPPLAPSVLHFLRELGSFTGGSYGSVSLRRA